MRNQSSRRGVSGVTISFLPNDFIDNATADKSLICVDEALIPNDNITHIWPCREEEETPEN